jgi:hypothetical protein
MIDRRLELAARMRVNMAVVMAMIVSLMWHGVYSLSMHRNQRRYSGASSICSKPEPRSTLVVW